MIKPELYKRTTDILYQAYFKGTLEHSNCYACAVGNMVAASCDITFEQKVVGGQFEWVWKGHAYPGHVGWGRVFITSCFGQMVDENNYIDEPKRQIDSTGYRLHELAKIEYAFEAAPRGQNDEDWMFNGLAAVLDVLKEIHQATDQDLLTNNNNRFKEQYQKRTSCAV